MVEKSFPMHDVSAMGQKLDGDVGSSIVEGFAISLMAAIFHWVGITDCDQQVLKRSTVIPIVSY